MPIMPVSERVRQAFDDATVATYGPAYLDRLLGTWTEITHKMRRKMISIAALVLGFLLVAGSHSTISLGPLRVTNVSAVLTIIPVLVAALLYEWAALMAAVMLYRSVVTTLIEIMHPSVAATSLEFLLAPVVTDVAGTPGRSWDRLRETPPGFLSRFLYISSLTIMVGLLAAGICFLIYAFRHLYADPHANGTAVSVSLGLSVLFYLRMLALMMDTPD